MKNSLIFLLICCSFAVNTYAQCGTDELEQSLLRTYPNYASERIALENFIQQRRNTNARIAITGCQPTLSTYIVPVVVHVMHLGEAVGTGTNISDAQIQTAMADLNQRWAFMNIQFVLAKRAPNGNATNGITRTDCSGVPNYASIGIDPSTVPTGAPDSTIKKINIWPWQNYINTWIVCKSAISAAYSNFPSSYSFQGNVVPYNAFGTPQNTTTFSHEMGHYFGLYHTFQGSTSTSCPPNANPLTDGDKVADTPPHKQSDCNYISCGRYTDSLNSIDNFMSYCSPGIDRFTQGQKERVIVSLFGEYRWSLVTSDGLIPATTLLEAKIDSIANDVTENICTNFIPKVRIKNLGTNVLTACKIQTYVDDALKTTTIITSINLQKDSSKIVSLLPISSVYNTHSFRFVLSQINGSDTDFFALNNSICGDITLVRNNYTVSISSNNGTTTGSGSYACDSIANLTATPNTCYQFTNWTENGNIISTNSTYSFAVIADRNLVANFERKLFTITLSNTPGGTVSGGGDVFCGSSLTVRAIQNSCYTFKNWTENGIIVSTNANYTFTVSASRNLVANFDKKRFTITVSSDNIANGTITGNGTYGCDTITTVTATPASCYTFTKWTENGITVSTNASYSFTVTTNRNLTANFTKKQYSISLSPNDASKGTVTGSGSYSCDTTVTIKAKVKTGAVWQNWTENSNIVSTDSTYTFTASSNRTLVANFTTATYSIAVTANPLNAGTITGGGTLAYGTTTSVQANPSTCYTFKNWTENGNIVSTNASYSFTINSARNLIANFIQKRFTVSLTTNDINKGTVSGNGTYDCDTTVTIKANIKTGNRWLNWTENGTVVSTDSVYTFSATANRTLVANFEQIITGIKQTSINEITKIFPNPANSILQIEIKSKITTKITLTILDITGRIIETKTLSSSKGISNTSFDVSKLSKGNYYLNLSDEEGIANYPFVVQ